MNRRFSALQRRNFRRIAVGADDLLSEFCKARRSDQPYIARSNHCELHDPRAPSRSKRRMRDSFVDALLTG